MLIWFAGELTFSIKIGKYQIVFLKQIHTNYLKGVKKFRVFETKNIRSCDCTHCNLTFKAPAKNACENCVCLERLLRIFSYIID